ncbi:MAG: glycosyltransferase [Oscillospiraceae bacterium]|nr:glycosyltransferase [Oscillospiraceae bacterium]
MTKISIIVPVYNTEKYLTECLNSLLSQTLQDIQIIIINDGSTDNSQEIINNFQSTNPNKITALTKPNEGLSSARNYALPHVKGEYIGFVDSDDYIHKDMYQKMYNLAKTKNSDLVECDYYLEFPNKTKIATNKNSNSPFTHGRVMACNKIYKTNLILKNNITFPESLKYEDIEFYYKLLPHVKNYKALNTPLYHYVQRQNSIINTQNENNKDIFSILNNILIFYKEKKLYTKHITELEYLYIRILLGSSFRRIVKIKNKKTRKKLLNQTINELYTKFPNWKNNHILKNSKSLKNIYYRTINKTTFKIYSTLFRFIS